MNIINEMNISFLSKSCNEAFARSAVASFVVQLDPTVAELSDIKTAVSEAVTNAIVHGYSNTIGTVTIKVQITDNGNVIIQVKDKGVGIENITQAMEPMFTTGGNERAGLGFAVMQTFMDRLEVFSRKDKGVRILMEKKLK